MNIDFIAKINERDKLMREEFTQTIDELPHVNRDVEFVPRWRCMDIVLGRFTDEGFYGEDRLWDSYLDVSYWRYV